MATTKKNKSFAGFFNSRYFCDHKTICGPPKLLVTAERESTFYFFLSFIIPMLIGKIISRLVLEESQLLKGGVLSLFYSCLQYIFS